MSWRCDLFLLFSPRGLYTNYCLAHLSHCVMTGHHVHASLSDRWVRGAPSLLKTPRWLQHVHKWLCFCCPWWWWPEKKKVDIRDCEHFFKKKPLLLSIASMFVGQKPILRTRSNRFQSCLCVFIFPVPQNFYPGKLWELHHRVLKCSVNDWDSFVFCHVPRHHFWPMTVWTVCPLVQIRSLSTFLGQCSNSDRIGFCFFTF